MSCGRTSLGGLRNDHDAYRLGYRVFAARYYRGERHQVGRRKVNEDNFEVTEYLSMTESDHSRAAMVFAAAAFATPFVIVAMLATIWLLFFN